MGKAILLSNLFNGEYIKESIGGEIINMYQSDNGRYYAYINPYGKIDQKWHNKIEHVLFIRSVGNKMVKVIAVAKVKEQLLNQGKIRLGGSCHPQQKEYIDKHQIFYGGVPLYELGSWSNFYVTFEVEGIYKAKKDIYLTVYKKKENEDTIFYLENVNRINNQSQKLYIENNSTNYTKIVENIIKNQGNWETEKVGPVNLEENSLMNTEDSFLSIIKKENDELVISNLLAYFLKNDMTFWSDFASKVLGLTDFNILNNKPRVTRETISNIDVVIEVDNYVLIIENKIKSGINSRKEQGYSQLEKYVNVANQQFPDKIHYFYLLRPNYNNENYKHYNKGEQYQEIKYSQIYDIIKNWKDDFYQQEFKKVVKKQSSEYNNELFEMMNTRFIDNILSKKAKLKKLVLPI